MISDCQILGIAETGDIAAIKSAFRKRAKELHPDLSAPEDTIRNHDLFSALCKAYDRLLNIARSEKTDRGLKGRTVASPQQLAVYRDQAYAFYKQGMKFYMAIHPSRWALDEGPTSSSKTPGSEKEQEALRGKVLDLVKLFPNAYFYFSIVVHEYPDSNWARDAREKMGIIEERIGRYRRIIESFDVWNGSDHMRMEEYQATYDRHRETRRAVRKDGHEGWI